MKIKGWALTTKNLSDFAESAYSVQLPIGWMLFF